MDNKSRTDWIDAAIAALRQGGIESVRVETIARELGVTKGSFYWHFRDRAELLAALLDAWEAETEWLIARANEAATPRDRLIRYFSLVPETRKRYPPDVEILAWARRDPKVSERVHATEIRRIGFFEEQLRTAGIRGAEARRRARIAFLATQGWIEQMTRHAHDGESFRGFATKLFDLVLSSPKSTRIRT